MELQRCFSLPTNHITKLTTNAFRNCTQELKSMQQNQYLVQRIQGGTPGARVKDKQSFICTPRAPVKIIEYLDQQCEEYVKDELAVGNAKKSNQRPFLRHPPPCVFLPFLRRRREYTGMYTVEKVQREAETLTHCFKKISPALNDTFHKVCYKHTPVHNNPIWEVSTVEAKKNLLKSPEPPNIRTVTIIKEKPSYSARSFDENEPSTVHYTVVDDNAYCNEAFPKNVNCHPTDHFVVHSLCSMQKSNKVCNCHKDATATDKNTHICMEKDNKPCPTIVTTSQSQMSPSAYCNDNLNEAVNQPCFPYKATQNKQMDSSSMHSNGSIPKCHSSQIKVSPTICSRDTSSTNKSFQLSQGACSCEDQSSTNRNENSTCSEIGDCCRDTHSRGCHREQQDITAQDGLNAKESTVSENYSRPVVEEKRTIPSTYVKSCCCRKNACPPEQIVNQRKCLEKDNLSLCTHGAPKCSHVTSCTNLPNTCHETYNQNNLHNCNENSQYLVHGNIPNQEGYTKNNSSYVVGNQRNDNKYNLMETHFSIQEPIIKKYTTQNLVCSKKVEKPRTVYICEGPGPSSQCRSDEKINSTCHISPICTPRCKSTNINTKEVKVEKTQQGFHVSCHPTTSTDNYCQSPKASMQNGTARPGLTHLRKWEVIGPFC